MFLIWGSQVRILSGTPNFWYFSQALSPERPQAWLAAIPFVTLSVTPKGGPSQRENGMATFRSRNCRVQVQIRLGNQAESKTFNTKKEARAWAVEREAELRKLAPVEGQSALSQQTLGELVERYRDNVAAKQKSYKRFFLPHLTAFLRHPICAKQLDKLTIKDFVEYRDLRLKKVKPQTLRNEFAIFKRLLKVAKKEWSIPITNFVAELEFKAKSREIERRIEPEEADLVRTTIANRESLSSETREVIQDIFDFALATGMRRGEILLVKPEHYSQKRRTLLIPETKIGEHRTIGLSPEACAILDRRSQLSPCFPIAEEAFKSYWQRILKKTGIKGLRFHDTRHEALSSFFEKGLTAPEVQMQAGHKNLRTTTRYSHAKLENILSKLQSHL
jgi:integrase